MDALNYCNAVNLGLILIAAGAFIVVVALLVNRIRNRIKNGPIIEIKKKKLK